MCVGFVPCENRATACRSLTGRWGPPIIVVFACPDGLGLGAGGRSVDGDPERTLACPRGLRNAVRFGVAIHVKDTWRFHPSIDPCENGSRVGRQFKCKELSTHRGSRVARDTQKLSARVEHSLRLWEVLGLGEVLQGV